MGNSPSGALSSNPCTLFRAEPSSGIKQGCSKLCLAWPQNFAGCRLCSFPPVQQAMAMLMLKVLHILHPP